MQNIIFAFSSIAPVFIQIMLGFFLRRKKVIDQKFINTSSDFVFHYLFPLVMFRQIYQIDITSNLNPIFIAYGVSIAIISGILLCLIVPRFIKDRSACGAFVQGSYRSNCVLIGVALSINLFGDTGSMPTIMLLPFASIVFNTISIIILTAMSPGNNKVSFRTIVPQVIKNPIILGAILGVIVSLSGIKFPSFASNVIDELAGMATPLALIGLGGQLEINSLFKKPCLIISSSFLKLILSPLLAIVPAILFFDFTKYEIGALLFIFGSSTAVSSFVMAKAMKSDDDLAGKIIMFTTIFSSVTMFLWIYILKTLQLI